MLPKPLAYDRLNDQMAEAIPEIANAYQEEMAWWDDEPAPSHVVFGVVLNPHISRTLATRDEPTLARIFDFLERMAADADSRVQDVLRDTVLEHMRDESSASRETARRFMGPATIVHWRQLVSDTKQ